MKNKIEFREFKKEENLVRIQKLFEACYGDVPLFKGGKYPSLKELEWRYLKCPIKSKIFVAEDIEKRIIVGIRPILLKKIKVNDSEGLGAQFMDVMVHPAYRGRGIFTKLMKMAYDYLKKENILVAYTFPNRNSYPAYKKVTDWQELSFFKVFVNIQNIFWSPKLEVDQDVNIETIENFDERVNLLLEKFLNLYDICIYRTSEYLNWRFIRRPDVEYKIISVNRGEKLVGYAVLRTRKLFTSKVGLIIELVCDPEYYNVFEMLIKHSLKEFKNLGVKWVLFFNFSNKNFEVLLRKNHFFQFSLFQNIRKIPLVIKPISKDLKIGSINLGNWYISLGDNDAV